jgi:hypothetical protein
MDADNITGAQPAPQPQRTGGTVEPSNRASVAKEKFQTPLDLGGERFELRDPFAEVTYRAKTLAEITAKADQVGSQRVTAVAEDGQRTPVTKVGTQWQRGKPLPAQPERPLDPGPAKGDVAATQPTPKAQSQPEQVDAKALAKIESDAERSALASRLEAALKDRYIIKNAPVSIGALKIGHTEYRFRGDSSRVAFIESTFKLATDTNSPSVARSMVDVAQARNWKGLRVSGSEDFRRLVWLEASVRGVKAIGYEPNPADLDVLRREQQARQTNRIEPTQAESPPPASSTDKPSARGSGGRKTVVAAIEAILVAKGVPEAKRAAVLEAANEKLAQRLRSGITPKVKVYDKTAEPQRTPTMPVPEQARARDRAAPSHAR